MLDEQTTTVDAVGAVRALVAASGSVEALMSSDVGGRQ